jgi:hypothetical protein
VAKYNGLGPWEKVRVALSTLTTDAEGFKTLNLRGPIDPEYFNPGYQVTGGSTSQGTGLVANVWGASPNAWPYPTSGVKVSGIFPLSRNGVGNATVPDLTHEYLFVLEDTGTESTQALYLRDFFTYATQVTGYNSNVDGLLIGVPKDVVVDTAIFNTLDAGFGRNLSEAITAPSIDKMADTSVRSIPGYADNSFTSITRFMQQPTNGDTVY